MQRPTELPLVKKKDVIRDACLKKQKSMTNLSFISGSKENGMLFSYQASWHEETSSSQVYHKEKKVKASTCLSRIFSQSVHSLLPDSSWESENVTPNCNVSPHRRSSYHFTGSQDLLTFSVAGCPQLMDDQPSSNLGDFRKSWSEEDEENCQREGTAHLDEEVIVTMLADLEQALYCEILGELPLQGCHIGNCGLEARAMWSKLM